MSSMLSAPATIPATSEATFNPAFAPLSVGHAQMLISQVGQPRPLGQGEDRDQARGRHQIRVIERHRHPREGVRESHPRGALPG